MLEICEREDPAYTVLHQTATFTAKRKDYRLEGSTRFPRWISAPAIITEMPGDGSERRTFLYRHPGAGPVDSTLFDLGHHG